jgi:hypothetical protein
VVETEVICCLRFFVGEPEIPPLSQPTQMESNARGPRFGKILVDSMSVQTVTRVLSRLGLDQRGTAALTRSEV